MSLMFSVSYRAIIVCSRLHVPGPLFPACCRKVAKRRPVDRTPSHLSRAAMLRLLLSSPLFPSSRLSILFKRMLVVMTFASNKHLRLSHLGLGGNRAVGRNWAPSSTVVLTTHTHTHTHTHTVPFRGFSIDYLPSPLQQTKGHETVHGVLPDNKDSSFYPYCH
jgi:hypothetical protein